MPYRIQATKLPRAPALRPGDARENRLQRKGCPPIKLARVSVFAAVVALGASPAARAEDDTLPDRLMLRLGGYRVHNADTLVRLDSHDAPVGAYIDFANTLGGDTSASVARLDGRYRFADRHALGFSWYRLHFTGSRALSADISWGDEIFTFGTTVESEIKIDVYKVNYQYSLMNTREAELGALIGLHVMGASVALSATGTGQAQQETVTAPLPVLGLFGRYNFTPRFSVYYNYQFFFINYQDEIKGGLQDFLLGAEYRLTRHFALGAAYNRFDLEIEDREDHATLYLNTQWDGLMLYGALYF